MKELECMSNMQRNNILFNKFLAENSQQCIVLLPAEKNSVVVVLKMLKNFGSV